MIASRKLLYIILFSGLALSCRNGEQKTTETKEETKSIITVKAPVFDAEGSYQKLATQVNFGYRVPNTPAHVKCGDWIVEQLKANGLEVIEQKFDAFSFKGKRLNARNIIGSYNPTATKRILLAAHWDTREVADQDVKDKESPIPGANDGASGVAILLQIAETIAKAEQKPGIGIDYVFFDVEDGGVPEGVNVNKMNDYGGYLMGSDYWSKNPHQPNYTAFYGILLDMVGAKNATFLKDKYSMQVAPSVVNKIWDIANEKGFSNIFVNSNGGDIMDDHLPVIINRKIPMIDIIDQKMGGNQTFFDHWHRHSDDLSQIDQNTLKAVGETVLQVLYEEQ